MILSEKALADQRAFLADESRRQSRQYVFTTIVLVITAVSTIVAGFVQAKAVRDTSERQIEAMKAIATAQEKPRQ